MSDAATLTVSSGPDRGRVFRLDDELVHIGSGAENQVALRDVGLPEHAASVIQKNGRYAIYTPLGEVIQIDGSPIPAEQWVWLPAGARIRLSDRTSLQFAEAVNGNGAAVDAVPAGEGGRLAPRVESARGASGPPSAAPASAGRKGSKAGEKKTGNVARFITDQPGDPLVRLGEDGHLPELALIETASRKGAEKKSSGSSPAVLYAVLGFSVLMSVGMLLIDADSFGSSAADRRAARDEITSYYGGAEAPLEEYQRQLREARLAQARGDRAAEREAYRRVVAL